MPTSTPPIPRREFAAKLLRWFAQAMRPLPWRVDYDPYAVWISEIMLQQTQMERGVRYFQAWMRRFPDVGAVAEASTEEVLTAWEGLGYYSRARNLHAAAKRIMREHGGVFPQSRAAIRALPGVGDYTAGAIAAIAFNQPETAVDANVLRIFARIRDIDRPPTERKAREEIDALARSLIPEDSPRLFCQALMELGALVCAKTPRCEACPVIGFCLAHKRDTTAMRPIKRIKPAYTLLEMATAVVIGSGLVFIRKRPENGLWAGLWEFPGGAIAKGESPEEAARRHAEEALGQAVVAREKIALVRHSYTTNRVTLHGFLCAIPGKEKPTASTSAGVWAHPDELASHAFPAGQRKLLERLGWKGGVP